jgi:hypothetical protein
LPVGSGVARQPNQNAVLESEREIVLRGDTVGRNPAGESGETEPSSGPDHPATTPANALRRHSPPPFACSPTRILSITPKPGRSIARFRPRDPHRITDHRGRVEIVSTET